MLRYKNCHLAPVSTSLLYSVKYSTLDFWPYVVCLWFEDHLSERLTIKLIDDLTFSIRSHSYHNDIETIWSINGGKGNTSIIAKLKTKQTQLKDGYSAIGHTDERVPTGVFYFEALANTKFEASSFVDWNERMFFSCGKKDAKIAFKD